MDVITTIVFIGIFQGIFIALSLVCTRQKTNKYSRLFLASLILFLCLHSLDSVLSYTREFYRYPHLFAIKDPFILLYGPLIFFYILSLIRSSFKLCWSHLLHLIPFVIYLFRLIPLYSAPGTYKIQVLDAMFANYNQIRDIEINLILSGHIFIYMLVTLIALIRAVAKKDFSKPHYNYSGYKSLFIFMSVLILVFLVNTTRFLTTYDLETILWMPLLISCCFFVLAYRSLMIENVLVLKPPDENVIIPKRSLELIKKLDSVMSIDKSYLKNDLNLDTLSKQLETNRQYLSRAINTIKGESFIKYVNGYRVEAAKEKLCSPYYENYSLEKIAEDSGFNSLSSFNRAFKYKVGKTPSCFRGQKNVNL